jgi:PST family polysaccharide transporter
MREIVLATVKAGSGQVVSLLCAALAVKVMATMLGPAGVGLFSVIRQFQQMLSAVASLGGHNAIVQGVASREGDARDQFVVSVFAIIAGLSVVAAGAIVVFAAPLALLVFGANQQVPPAVMQWTGLAVAVGALLVFFRSLLNAHMEIGAVAWVNVTAAAAALALAFPTVMAYNAGYRSALALLLVGSLGCGLLLAIRLGLARRHLSPLGHTPPRVFDRAAVRHFFRVALPSLVAMFVGLGSVLLVKAAVAREHGLSAAGQFDAAWSVSTIYLMVFLTSLHTYLLPALSAHGAAPESHEVIDRGLRLAVIVAAPLIVGLIVFKPLAVRLLYSGEFIEALQLLRWTLLGDYIRVAGWVLATALFARADMRAYLACEILWSVVFVTMTSVLLEGGIAGAGPAYVVAYAVYLAVLWYRARTRHGVLIRGSLARVWLAGASIVLLASLFTWTDVRIALPSIAWLVLAALFGWFALERSERQRLGGYLARRLGR